VDRAGLSAASGGTTGDDALPVTARTCRWSQCLGPDRAEVVFSDTADVQRRSAALQALLRQWIALV